NIGAESILSDSILYISAEGAYSRLFIENKKEVIVSRNLKSILELLNSSKFFRIHRSQIINLNHILSVNEKKRIVTLKNKVECEISERRLSEFLEFLKQQKKKW
ncbi:MAG: LytTR family DNA-binding domain-containing protein, partial [Flavobacteriales bacterium]